MSQLLIVILSIAMMSALLIAGAWYGGGKWLEGGSLAQAEQLINTAQQIAQAWHAYAQENDTYEMPDYNWYNGNDDLVPKYMASWPSLGMIKGQGTVPNHYMNFLGLQSGNWGYGIVKAIGIPIKICQQVEVIAKGTATVEALYAQPSVLTPQFKELLKPFRCFANYPNTGDFFYRVF